MTAVPAADDDDHATDDEDIKRVLCSFYKC